MQRIDKKISDLQKKINNNEKLSNEEKKYWNNYHKPIKGGIKISDIGKEMNKKIKKPKLPG